MKSRVRGSIAILLLVLGMPAGTADIAYSTVKGFGDVSLVVAESGESQGPAILFIHGFSQGALSWKYQLHDPELQRRFRMVAFDLRGHGASGKPWEPSRYDRQSYGEDVAAVIEAKNLHRPVLVAWSFGGEITMAYLREHGPGNIAGLVLVAAPTYLNGPPVLPPPEDRKLDVMDTLKQMQSPDVAINFAATRRFVGSLFAKPPTPEDMEETLMLNMLMPAYVREATGNYIPDNSDLAGKVRVPTLIVHGGHDAIVPVEISASSTKVIDGSTLLIYGEVGHAPFFEDAVRFNRDIQRFVERTSSNGG